MALSAVQSGDAFDFVDSGPDHAGAVWGAADTSWGFQQAVADTLSLDWLRAWGDGVVVLFPSSRWVSSISPVDAAMVDVSSLSESEVVRQAFFTYWAWAQEMLYQYFLIQSDTRDFRIDWEMREFVEVFCKSAISQKTFHSAASNNLWRDNYVIRHTWNEEHDLRETLVGFLLVVSEHIPDLSSSRAVMLLFLSTEQIRHFADTGEIPSDISDKYSGLIPWVAEMFEDETRFPYLA